MSPKVALPRHVHCFTSRGRDYFYYQEGRNTAAPGPRIRLPDDTQSPAFWAAVREAQGLTGDPPVETVAALIAAYKAAWPILPRKLSKGTQEHYARYLKPAEKA